MRPGFSMRIMQHWPCANFADAAALMGRQQPSVIFARQKLPENLLKDPSVRGYQGKANYVSLKSQKEVSMGAERA